MIARRRVALGFLLLSLCVAGPVYAQSGTPCVPTSDVDGASDWTKSSGTTMFNLLTTAIPTSQDTDHITNNSTFNVYAIVGKSCTVPGGATISNVRVRFSARFVANAPNCSARLRVNGTNYENFGAESITGSYATYDDDFPTNPAGGSWTVTEANGGGTNPLQGFGARCEDGTRINAMDITFTYTGGASNTPANCLLLGVCEEPLLEARRPDWVLRMLFARATRGVAMSPRARPVTPRYRAEPTIVLPPRRMEVLLTVPADLRVELRDAQGRHRVLSKGAR